MQTTDMKKNNKSKKNRYICWRSKGIAISKGTVLNNMIFEVLTKSWYLQRPKGGREQAMWLSGERAFQAEEESGGGYSSSIQGYLQL